MWPTCFACRAIPVIYCFWLNLAAIPHFPPFSAIQVYYFKLSCKSLYKSLYVTEKCNGFVICHVLKTFCLLSYSQIDILVEHTCSPFVSSRQIRSSRITGFNNICFPWISYLFSAIKCEKEGNSFYQTYFLYLQGEFLWLLLWSPFQNKVAHPNLYNAR